MDTIKLSNGAISVVIARKGAELQSLADAQGREWLWQADPTFWGRHAPILFPIVGRAANDQVRIDGSNFPIGQHGFARDCEFEVLSSGPERAGLRLIADVETRRHYPFDFELDIRFELAGTTLYQTVTIRNQGATPMPASVGFHPGFQWPLPGASAPQTGHVVIFEREECADIRRLKTGGVDAAGYPTPVEGKVLPLDPSLFLEDAVIFDDLKSRSLWFGAPGSDGIRVDFPDLPYLGIWTKPGAPFLCLEPWQGHAAPAGFDGEMADMPGMVVVPPTGSVTRHIAIRIAAPAP
ncbi:MAG TPA: aldose 1-epimerase family protein [Kaistia sp.]|nr:aldose 1-epimerase family protein [Kaistia sp.]